MQSVGRCPDRSDYLITKSDHVPFYSNIRDLIRGHFATQYIAEDSNT